jgi:hypothetical protein
MSKATVASARIVRYPDVVAHLTTCAKCKADGGTALMYEGAGIVGGNKNGRLGCAKGRELDRRHFEAYSEATREIREQVKQFVRPLVARSMETLGIDFRSIVEALETTFQEMIESRGGRGR